MYLVSTGTSWNTSLVNTCTSSCMELYFTGSIFILWFFRICPFSEWNNSHFQLIIFCCHWIYLELELEVYNWRRPWRWPRPTLLPRQELALQHPKQVVIQSPLKTSSKPESALPPKGSSAAFMQAQLLQRSRFHPLLLSLPPDTPSHSAERVTSVTKWLQPLC